MNHELLSRELRDKNHRVNKIHFLRIAEIYQVYMREFGHVFSYKKSL